MKGGWLFLVHWLAACVEKKCKKINGFIDISKPVLLEVYLHGSSTVVEHLPLYLVLKGLNPGLLAL